MKARWQAIKKHKRKHTIKKRVMAALDLPMETLKGAAKVTLLGKDSAVIENHGAIMTYTSSLVRIDSPMGIIAIGGKALTILELGAERVYITGEILSANYEE